MKRILGFVIVVTALSAQLRAQESKPTANPVTAVIKQQLERRSKIMLAAADLMPADKYSFRPTPEQMTFGHLILHTAIANGKVCSAITGAAEPKIDVKDTDPKEKLIQAFKDSFDFCSAQLANVDDSKLGDEVT